MVTKGDALGLEKSKCHPYPQKWQEKQSREIKEQILPEIISKYFQPRRYLGSSQHGFMKGK